MNKFIEENARLFRFLMGFVFIIILAYVYITVRDYNKAEKLVNINYKVNAFVYNKANSPSRSFSVKNISEFSFYFKDKKYKGETIYKKKRLKIGDTILVYIDTLNPKVNMYVEEADDLVK
jgi:hypothetical protein